MMMMTLKQDWREWSADDLDKFTKVDLKKIGYLMGLNLDTKKQKVQQHKQKG